MLVDARDVHSQQKFDKGKIRQRFQVTLKANVELKRQRRSEIPLHIKSKQVIKLLHLELLCGQSTFSRFDQGFDPFPVDIRTRRTLSIDQRQDQRGHYSHRSFDGLYFSHSRAFVGSLCILIQQFPEGKRIVSFNSRILDKAEHEKSTLHRELCWLFSRLHTNEHYKSGTPFPIYLYCDHKS